MKIHQQKEKIQIVTDIEKLMKIAICLSESPVLKNRVLALEIKTAMDVMNSEKG